MTEELKQNESTKEKNNMPRKHYGRRPQKKVNVQKVTLENSKVVENKNEEVKPKAQSKPKATNNSKAHVKNNTQPKKVEAKVKVTELKPDN